MKPRLVLTLVAIAIAGYSTSFNAPLRKEKETENQSYLYGSREADTLARVADQRGNNNRIFESEDLAKMLEEMNWKGAPIPDNAVPYIVVSGREIEVSLSYHSIELPNSGGLRLEAPLLLIRVPIEKYREYLNR